MKYIIWALKNSGKNYSGACCTEISAVVRYEKIPSTHETPFKSLIVSVQNKNKRMGY